MGKITKDIIIGNRDFTIQLELGSNGVYVKFMVFQPVGEVYSEKGVTYDPPRRNYERKGASSGADTTYDIADAKRYFEGSVKWDGCSDINFFPDEGGNSHFCGKTGAVRLGQVLAVIYDEAREVMPGAVHDLSLYEDT